MQEQQLTRPGVLVARHSSPGREGATLRTPDDFGTVDVLWFDNGETERVAADELMEVVKLPGERTTVEASARNPLAELMAAAPGDIVFGMTGSDEPRDCPDEELPYRLEYVEDVRAGAVLLLAVECRERRCRLAHHERECQVLEVRERGDVYSLKALDPDGKQVPLRGDALVLVKVKV